MERETIVREIPRQTQNPVRHLSPPRFPDHRRGQGTLARGRVETLQKPLLRNHKGDRHYLVCFDCYCSLAIHDLEHRLRQGKLTFASPQRMERYLGLATGFRVAVRPYQRRGTPRTSLFLRPSSANVRQFEFPPQRLPSHGGHFPPRIRTLPLPGRKDVRIPRPLRLTRLKSAAPCE